VHALGLNSILNSVTSGIYSPCPYQNPRQPAYHPLGSKPFMVHNHCPKAVNMTDGDEYHSAKLSLQVCAKGLQECTDSNPRTIFIDICEYNTAYNVPCNSGMVRDIPMLSPHMQYVRDIPTPSPHPQCIGDTGNMSTTPLGHVPMQPWTKASMFRLSRLLSTV
jgi:hypothetical protein